MEINWVKAMPSAKRHRDFSVLHLGRSAASNVLNINIGTAVHAMAFADIAGELAAEHSRTEGAGTFRVSFLDSFDKVGPQYMEAKMRVTEEM